MLTSLPKVQLDTEERREGYLARLRGLPGMLATVAQRHEDGRTAGTHGGGAGSSSPPSRNSTS